MIVKKNNYDELGFVISDHQIVPDELIHLGLEGVQEILEGKFDTEVSPYAYSWEIGEPLSGVCEMNGAHLCNTKIRRLCLFKPMIDFMASTVGAKSIKLVTSQMFYKSAFSENRGKKENILYHQDAEYLRGVFSRAEIFSCWIPLCDMNEKNGSMYYVARSHLMGPGKGGIDYDQFDIGESRFKEFDCYKKLVEVPKGFLSVHHGELYHGSGRNLSNKPRIAIVLHCLKDEYVQLKRPSARMDLEDPLLCPVLL